MPEFIYVCDAGELGDPDKQVFEVDDTLVALFHIGGQFYAIDDVCTHDGGPLASGELYGHQIACPRHGARFDVRTGQVLSMPATKSTRSHEVKMEEGKVYVKLAD